MDISRHLCALAACLLQICISLNANASLVLTIDRLNDYEAIISGTGSLTGIAPTYQPHIIEVDNPFGINPSSNQNDSIFVSSTLAIGARSINFAYDAGDLYASGFGGVDSFLYFGSSSPSTALPVNSAISGELHVSLPGGVTFAAVGSTGDIYWGWDDTVVGTWTMVSSVPIPGAIWLFGSGLLSLVGMARRNKAA